jgi:hypothetical protein
MSDETTEQHEESADTATIVELAKRHGHMLKKTPIAGDDPFSAAHNVASVLNGWKAHEVSTGEIVTLTDADYLAAVEAAKAGKAHAPTCLRKAKDKKCEDKRKPLVQKKAGE